MSFGCDLTLDGCGDALILPVIVVVKRIIVGRIHVDILLVLAITILVVKAILDDVDINTGLALRNITILEMSEEIEDEFYKVRAIHLNPILKFNSRTKLSYFLQSALHLCTVRNMRKALSAACHDDIHDHLRFKCLSKEIKPPHYWYWMQVLDFGLTHYTGMLLTS